MRSVDKNPVLDTLSLLQRRLAGPSLIAVVATVAAGRAARAQLEV